METGWVILGFIAAAAGTLVVGLMLKWVDRKVTALVQYRVGPPWYQPFADIMKLMGKENMMPVTARGTGFLLAPIIALATASVAALVLWWAAINPGEAFIGDLIVVVYLLIIPALMTMMGAAASGNPHASVGAAREMKLLLSYELPLFVAILVAVARNGWTFQIGALSGNPAMFSISGVLAIIVTIICVQAKLGLVPFDLAEAECEIMSGVYVEYSGPSLACWLMTRAMLLALMPLLVILIFWGGLNTGAWWGYLSFAGKYVLLIVLTVLIRNTNPRVRIDQAVRFFWFGLTPVAVIAMILAIVGIHKGLTWL